ncbi:MAG: GNAT family N-acetyltransferase [Oscillospiraceae bacterium]|nr:GNAT family N-acetyltransferase [Oscillospiraceae bacterium]
MTDMTNIIEIKTASEKEISVIVEILEDTVAWLDGIGSPLWRKQQVQWERLSKDFSASDFYIAYLDKMPAGCMAVVDYDPEFWAGIPKGESLFIHKLAVKRFAAGKGLSDALISHAKSMCAIRGISELRLDCSSDRPKLRAVYERNGFICVEEKIIYEKYPTAFYKFIIYTDE